MRKLRTRILVGGAVAVFAGATAFAVTSTADATTTANTTALASTAAKTGTTLSVTAARSTIQAGQQDTIGGTLLAGGNPAAGRVVELYRYNDRAHRWRLIRVKLTGKTGAVSFTVQPYITRQYELAYRGNSTLAATKSSATTVTVQPSGVKRATALSVSAAPASITSGHTTTISGVLSTSGRPLRHRTVSLYRYDPSTKKWVRVAVELTGPRGGVRFVRAPSATATFALAFSGGPVFTAARSAQTTVTVTG
jgi:5-hydroxyisourate hydrolase-like protein (transthyretin family)